MVELRHVTLSYGSDADGVSDLSLTIEQGEFCFITGRSGSGKSTLSKILTGELTPTEGVVKVNGYNLRTLKRKQKSEARRTIGMVFQDFRLINSMTVQENLEFAMRCVNSVTEEIEPRTAEVLDLVELTGKNLRFPTQLSGGEQQRLAIARSLINKPRLIVADEPTGNLDPDLAEEIMDIFQRINKLGTTTIVITHAKELVEKYQTRVITLSDGKVSHDGVGEYKL